ncbi:MAG: hypothetical protein HY704_04525 [Gemmatimonadetes bacterium]|nr:hypothetical protein [Gemmatimonadota bacterium]
MRHALVLSLTVQAATLAACSGERAAERQPAPADTSAAPRAAALRGRIYERRIAVVAVQRDSTILIPVFFTARTSPDRVDRQFRVWIAMSGVWDPFFDAEWHGPATRTPWRILPHRALRLVVGPEDALERILYQEGARNLEIVFGLGVTEWTGQRGEWYRVQRATARLAGRSFAGTLVDMTRARAADDPAPGDWIFLVAGDTLQLLLEDPNPTEHSDSTYHGWARLRSDDYEWPTVHVTWSRVRPFERARRDVPLNWEFVSEDNALAGALEAGTPHLVVGQGIGPVLPVEGLFDVHGRLRIGQAYADVRGLARHIQR